MYNYKLTMNGYEGYGREVILQHEKKFSIEEWNSILE